MDASEKLALYLKSNPDNVGKVVDFNPIQNRLFQFDFTASNKELDIDTLIDTAKFTGWVKQKLHTNNCKYGIGGYMEHRTVYARSPFFDAGAEPRRLHLGVDIWGDEGTQVYCPMQGNIHSFNNNDHYGDYGPTIIIEHNLDGLLLYTLYGHLNRESLLGLSIGQAVDFNQQIAAFGNIKENGQWPPHLHFQLMFDMEGKQGDYPGVCRFSEKDIYQKNIPDPQMILKFPKAANN